MTRSFFQPWRRALLVATALALAGTAAQARETVRISFQRSSTLLTLIKASGALEKKLAPLGYDVSWHELNGNALLQALNTGSVDIHADVADAYILFTQAANAPLTYFAKETSAPSAQAVIVPAESPIKSIADLKGKRVTVLKGAGAHYLLLTALKQAGLKPTDIDLRFLDQQDGVTAYNGGAVDAISIWDPLLGVQLQSGKSRVLADGRNTNVEYSRYYTATTAFAKAHPQVLKVVFDELQATGRWVKANPAEAATRLSPIWGNVPAATVDQVNSRRSYAIVPVVRNELGELQRIADTFREAGLINRELKATTVDIWSAPQP
ncbi:aliphatic sulfonate ABC transporter substrate-binding protein [Piscinibacter sp. HJYY11]|uniref:aliphatic sulfonate ABC transporter substrate-binding protein n=1 Tax=Piscinibacter sp. HJYY11 TaxID=2801333 RepID=UPI00191ECC1E|nr:aliphatic sulfonate ABC transporter substrate-binding protein [Piscinibacter sp. HJYY11]MBL0728610.1 aliphatic sulfonate ABC transporter substrate-binding protein [Piscinibacter sp. HJYY11]